jgi:hypothetical protein
MTPELSLCAPATTPIVSTAADTSRSVMLPRRKCR